jgi:quercetin dioxygenase-like cupin family protein
MICYARLGLEVPIANLQSEINALLQSREWMPHYNKVHYEGDWTVLPLRTPGGDPGKPFAELMSDSTYEDTYLVDMLPSMRNLLEQLHCEKLSVRLLNLRAGSIIKEHRDFDLAFEQGEARLHVPIVTNPKVEFYVDGDLVCMQEGECWYINANLPHRVANKGEYDRIHLVIDCEVNDWLIDVFGKAEKREKEVEKDIERQRVIIQNLRMHNSETSNMLADKLEGELND